MHRPQASALNHQLSSLNSRTALISDKVRNNFEEILVALDRPITRNAEDLKDLHDDLTRKQRLEILHWMSKIPYRQRHLTFQKDLLPISGAWLQQIPEYVEWRRSSSSSVLWLHGIPGSEKTKLVSLVIQELRNEMRTTISLAPLAYFYCANNPAEPGRADPDEIMSSLLKQLSNSKADELIREPVIPEY